MNDKPNSVAFEATLKSVRTAQDGGFVVAFDVPENQAAEVAKMMVQFKEQVLSVACVIAPGGK